MERPRTTGVTARDVDQASAGRLAGRQPSRVSVSPSARDITRPSIHDGQPVQMAAVLGSDCAVMNRGFHLGTKLCTPSRVHRQEKSVLTTQSSPPHHAIS